MFAFGLSSWYWKPWLSVDQWLDEKDDAEVNQYKLLDNVGSSCTSMRWRLFIFCLMKIMVITPIIKITVGVIPIVITMFRWSLLFWWFSVWFKIFLGIIESCLVSSVYRLKGWVFFLKGAVVGLLMKNVFFPWKWCW